MPDYFLEKALISLKTIVFDPKKPSSTESKRRAETLVDATIHQTRKLQGFTVKDFLNLIQISVIGVAYSQKGINDPFLLMALTGVVPDDLSPKSIYRKVDDGKPRLWYFSDVGEEVRIKERMDDRYGIYSLFRSYGEYSLFVSGIFSDMLQRKRRLSADISYYEATGKQALFSASNSKVVADTAAAASLEELAKNFKEYRRILTEASARIGAPARQRFLEDQWQKLGLVKGQGSNYNKQTAEERLSRKQALAGLEPFKPGYKYSVN
jgi:hypothetical protein